MGSIQCFFLIAAATGAGETVLLDFTADDCVHCRNMEPVLRHLTTDGFPIRHIDGRRNPQWTEHYRVSGFPTFIMISNGQEVDRVEGFTSHTRLLAMYQKASFTPPGNQVAESRSQSPDEPDGGFNLPNHLTREQRPDTSNPSQSNGASLTKYRSRNERNLSTRQVSYTTGAQSLSAEQTAYGATVRLRVEDAAGYSFGTGTIIDAHGDEALILTCGHIFRTSKGQGRITVDVLDGSTPRTVEGQLVSYESETADIGFVTFRPGFEVVPVLVAPPSYRPERGTKVFSIGCNGGQSATLKQSHVTAIDRYAGPPNIEVAGMPVNGRSGGGLFNADGMLIGVCNAADDQDDEGIYAALGTIHEKLAAINQKDISRRAETLLAQAPRAAPDAADVPDRPFSTFGSPSPRTGQITQAIDRKTSEIFVVIPGGTIDGGGSQTLVIPNPSPSLLRQLQQESQMNQDDPANRLNENNLADRYRRPWPKEFGGEVLRGQSKQ